MKDKKIITILTIFTIIFTFFGGTLAYLSWQTSEEQQTNVTFAVEQDFSCAADGGGDITSTDNMIAPADCTNSTYAIQREVTVTPTITGNNINVSMDLWLDINNLGTGLSNSQNFKYALTTSNTSCKIGIISSGTFNGKVTGDKVNILEESFSASTTKTYYLYIWLDSAETSTETMDQTFNFSLNGSCTNKPAPYSEPILNGAEPQIDDAGMIPVTISEDGTTKTVAVDSSSWYSYENKEWANAILVTSDSRSKYLNTNGVTVTASDILAYYVWIPKYSYKMNGTEEEISIEFNNTPDGYISHPAFEFDENMNGFWVGKFETSNNATTPKIVPNAISLRSQNVSTQFQTALKFSGGTLSDGVVTYAGNNTYGLTANTNSHMMKNSEWGAVAYLSHSRYGINEEIYINNSSYSYTGKSGGTVGGNVEFTNNGSYSWTGPVVADRTLGTKASTTGNVTGVYDMSGGLYDSVMGVLADSSGNPRSGRNTSDNSGFNGVLEDGTMYEEGIDFPQDRKYYDLYTSTNSSTACNGGVCLGHALSETASWYGDSAYFATSRFSWFSRVGSYSTGNGTGVFHFDSGNGGSSNARSWRSVLVVLMERSDLLFYE